MNIKQAIDFIDKSHQFLKKIGLIQGFINPSLLKPNKQFNAVAFNSSCKYEEMFLSGLENQYYNIILKDYSYFQFSFKENESHSSLHPFARYAFYPNPFESIDGVLYEIYTWFKDGDIDFEDYSQALSEANPKIKTLPIRFDLSYLQYKKIYHPVAHFHFGLSENSRIATDKIFNPLIFTMLIVNTYYLENWKNHSDSQYSLELDYKLQLSNCEKIKDCNVNHDKYFCDLQNALICLR